MNWSCFPHILARISIWSAARGAASAASPVITRLLCCCSYTSICPQMSPYQAQICRYLSLSSHSYLLIPPFSSVPTPQRHQSLTPPASSSASLRFASSVRARRQRCCCPRLLRGVVSERRGWQERFGKRQIKVNKRSGICRETAVVFNTVRVFSPANIVPVTFCTNLSDSWAKAPFDWLDYSLVENN